MSYNRFALRTIIFESNPRCTGSTPATGAGAGAVAVTAMPGSGYVTGARALLVNIATLIGIACTVPVVGSPTAMTCTTPIVPLGNYRLCVQNPDGAITSTPWVAT